VPENRLVEAGDVDGGEDEESGEDDGIEQKLVGVEVAEEGELVLGLIGVEAEHGATNGLEFPCGNENKPGKLGEYSSTGTEDRLALRRVLGVAVVTEITAVGAVDDDRESSKTAASHDGTVDDHVRNDLLGENTNLDVVRRTTHNLTGRSFFSETESGEGGRKHVDPEDLKRSEREDGGLGFILESEANTEEDDFSDVGDEQVEDELLDIVEHATAFLNSLDNTGKVVVRENKISGGFRDI